MSENAFVTWVQHTAPWEIEGELIRELRPPLNLAETHRIRFTENYRSLRRQAKARARSLDALLGGFSL
jgi:hypothetical protein